jgi:hypothetical protein
MAQILNDEEDIALCCNDQGSCTCQGFRSNCVNIRDSSNFVVWIISNTDSLAIRMVDVIKFL